VYETGRGSIRLRARYNYDKSQNCIDILSIPSTTTSEVIIERIIDLVKQGRIKEIADIRDETGLDGLKITIDLKRNVNPDILMAKLFKLTTLEDSYACNFNVLIGGVPMVLGVKGLLNEWIAFRMECVRRRTYFDRTKKAERLHLLEGLAKILLDIDKAIKIIRETDEEIEVVPNLMIGFGIDKTQAEYVAEIKLRHLNREYILKRTQDIEQLEKEIAELDDILKSKARIKTIIVRELKAIAAQYGEPRRSIIIYEDTVQYVEEAAAVPDYACTFFFTKEGYFKKITPQSLRMSGAHKLKDGDEIMQEIELSNNCDLLFFTDKAQVYKAKASDFSDTKTSVLGDYVAAKLGMDEGENAVYLVATKDYKGLLLFAFENGKAAKVPLEAYATKTNRKKLTGAYSDKAPMTAMLWLDEDKEVLFSASSGRMLLIHTGVLALKATRTTQGVAVMKLKKGQQLIGVKAYAEGTFVKPQRYRTRSLPGLGALPTGEDKGEEQLSLI
ncbi:MAG: DNA gyrase subunit A, partial [Ruminococcus sp.]|nr:DNA gyrase subunit A [Ruminococcus sp.]